MAKEKMSQTPPMNEPPTVPKKPAMTTVGQVVEFVEERIVFAYQRPDMAGGSAEGLDLVLLNDHQLWAVILGREDEFHRIQSKVCLEVGCGTMGFATFFRREKPNASEQELCGHVIAQWKRIDQRLNMPSPD